jgi:hypothetical protein
MGDDKGTLENASDKVFIESNLIDNAIHRNDSTAIVACLVDFTGKRINTLTKG